jgi:hypothetical protein
VNDVVSVVAIDSRFVRLGVAWLALVSGAATARAQASDQAKTLSIGISGTFVCADSSLTLTAKGNDAASTTWSVEPMWAGTLSASQGTTVSFQATGAEIEGPSETAYGGDVTRATIGFEQIGASGIQSAQKLAFDWFATRPITRRSEMANDATGHYLGPRLRWWGEVRVASYPQAATAGLAAFATDFVTTAGKTPVNKLVQSAEFNAGLEMRILGSPTALRGVEPSIRHRTALMVFTGGGAVGPFAPETEELAVFRVPAATAVKQREAFTADFQNVTSEFVAFRAKLPDRFLTNYTTGLRLYSHFAESGGTNEPLATPPAMVSASYGWNRLISANKPAMHFSAYFPFALGDRTDATSPIIYLFGDVWMTGNGAEYRATEYQLVAAKDGEKAILASDPRVTIVSLRESPRDTYRIGVSVDLLKVWKRLTTVASEGSKTAGK